MYRKNAQKSKPLLLTDKRLPHGIAIQLLIIKVIVGVLDVDALAAARRPDMRTMHIGSDLGEDQVDGATDDIVTPCSVIIAVGLLRQRVDALADAGPLLVGTGAKRLRGAANGLDGLELEIPVRQGGRGCCLNPAVSVETCQWGRGGGNEGRPNGRLQIGNPGVVFQHGALVVESPERHLFEWGQGLPVVRVTGVDDAAVEIDD